MEQPLANIHPEAKIGKDVVIEAFATIGKDVEIGDGTWVGANAVITGNTKVGKNCRIFYGAIIGAIPQDLKYKGEKTSVEIGDNTTIRECVTINLGTAAKGKTVVGSNCLLMAYVHIAHDCIVGNNVIIGNTTGLAGEVVVHDNAILSAGCLIHQFVHIGAHIILQGGSKVGKDIPPYITAGREPLSFAGLNSIGLRRRKFSNEKIQEIQEIYRILYQSDRNTTQAIDYIEAELPASKERDEVINFVRNSQRGIIPGYSSKK